MKLKYNFFAQTAIQLLIQNNTEAREIYSLPGISFNETDPLDSDLSIEFIHHLILFYKEKMQSQHCGLEIIQHLDFQNADFFGPYAYSCSTLGEAIQNIFAVVRQLNPMMTFELTPADKPSHFVYHLDKMWEAKYPGCWVTMILVIFTGLLNAGLEQHPMITGLLMVNQLMIILFSCSLWEHFYTASHGLSPSVSTFYTNHME